MSWHGHLTLDYRRDGERTIAHDRHDGPLRVLQRLYPEGPGVCHHVLVHPPGGIVGGDELDLQVALAPDTHGLITTPGATRFYKSAGPEARQSLHARLADDARLEWLPLETIAYRGARARNEVTLTLAPLAEMIGWDIVALGLPAAGEAFDDPRAPHGRYTQHLELPGVWLERGTVAADDARLLDSPLGWAGRRVMGTMWFAAGRPLAPDRRDALLDAARQVLDEPASGDASARQAIGGASSPHEPVVVVRVLGERVEPVMSRLVAIWSRWRPLAWALPPCPPRVWRT